MIATFATIVTSFITKLYAIHYSPDMYDSVIICRMQLLIVLV